MSQQDQSLQYLVGLEQENNRLRQELANEKKHVVFLNDTLAKASQVTGFMHEEPYRSMLGLTAGDNTLIQGVPELKGRLDKALQEVNRLTNENAFLRRELYPPESPKKELKYWIVTWLDNNQIPNAVAVSLWTGVLSLRDDLKNANCTNLHIHEQRVLL